jgi:carboxyl-terminal processing protease
MKSRGWVIAISIVVVLVLVSGACSAGFLAGRFLFPAQTPVVAQAPEVSLPQPEASSSTGTTATPEELEELFKPFWEAWDLLHEQYVDQPLDDEQLMRGALSGMMDSLGDPYTSYMEPEEYQMLNDELQGNLTYEGIGAWVDTTKDFLTIISPMPGSPADKAGLKPGDRIIAIDGEDMSGVDGELVRQKVLGPAGSTVTLTILRNDQEPFDVAVTRDSIKVPTLENRMLEGDIAYVHLFVFGENTKRELRNALSELLDQKPKGLILDLRFNGGGYLETAIDVASEFIDEGVIMYEEYGDGSRKTYEARPGGLATDIPLVVLINEGSASASEIVAGALQDRERALLVGETSFGKGLVQIPTVLQNDQGAVRITVARWLTPNESMINGVGLTPDYAVEITDEDANAGRDPQLDKAVELLSK